MTSVRADDQDAVEKLTNVAGTQEGWTEAGGGSPTLPEGSVKLSAPNFLSKAARKDLYRFFGVAGGLSLILAFVALLLVHGDPTANWAWSVNLLALAGMLGWFLAYLLVAGFGNVNVTVGSASDGQDSAPAGTGPTIDPKDGAADVATDIAVTATFATDVDKTTVTTDSFVLNDAANHAVDADVAYDEATKKATLTPKTALLAATKYTAKTTTDIKDKAGKEIAESTATFTTKGAAAPAN